MIKGTFIAAGAMSINGEALTGVFVECTPEQLMLSRLPIYREVTISTASEIKEAAKRAPNSTKPETIRPCSDCRDKSCKDRAVSPSWFCPNFKPA